jgi:hypothetical protein
VQMAIIAIRILFITFRSFDSSYQFGRQFGRSGGSAWAIPEPMIRIASVDRTISAVRIFFMGFSFRTSTNVA